MLPQPAFTQQPRSAHSCPSRSLRSTTCTAFTYSVKAVLCLLTACPPSKTLSSACWLSRRSPHLSVGCFQDDQIFDTSFTPPSPMKRRMWRRLGQTPAIDSWECARRAFAAGYPLFGLTSGELYPAYGWQCW